LAYIGKNPKFDGVILDDQVTDSVTAPKSGSYKLINRNGSLFNVNSSGVESAVGTAAAGEINYIDEWDAETAVVDWATYADAAGTTPVDGTGGTANITWTRQSSTILRGTQSYKLTKDAANRQGEGASYDFTIKTQDTNKKLKIQFDFKTDEDAAFAQGDLTVYVYDVTNSTLITPVDVDITKGQNIFQTSFNSTDSTSYRLIFHVATTNASAWDVYIDNIIVGPGMTSQGAAIGPWTSYTTNISNLTTAIEMSGGLYRRVGDSMEVLFSIEFSGANSDGQFKISAATTLPGGYTADLTDLDPGFTGGPDEIAIGQYFYRDGNTYYNGVVMINAGNGEIFGSGDDGNTSFLNPGTHPTAVADGDIYTFHFTVPISEWRGKGIVPMLAEDNLGEWTSFTPSWVNGASSPSTNVGFWRRVGGDLEIAFRRIEANSDGTGSSLILELPNSYTYDLTKIPHGASSETSSASGVIKGSGGWYDSSAGTMVGLIAAPGGSSNRISFSRTDADTVGFILGSEIDSSDEFNGTFIIPITEFAGSQNSLVGYANAAQDSSGLITSYAPIIRSALYEPGDASYTILDRDGYETFNYGTTLTGDRTLTLPTLADNYGRRIRVKRSVGGSNTLTLDGEGSETIDGVSSIDLNTDGDYIVIEAGSSEWLIVDFGILVFSHFQTNDGDSYSTGNIMDWEDLVTDTHSAVTVGASWKFTAPVDGLYAVTALAHDNTASKTGGLFYGLDIYKNGSMYARLSIHEMQATAAIYLMVGGSIQIKLSATDYIDFRYNISGGDSFTCITQANTNNVTISRIGG